MASTPFSKLYDVEVVGGDQRTRLAELLRSQGLNQPQGQMVGGWYVPPSMTQNLNSALQLGLGTYMGIKAEDDERKNLQEDIQRFTAAQQAKGLRAAGQPTTQEQQATTSAYPSTPAQGQVQEGQFRAMKTGGVEGMQSVPGYSMAQPQPQVDPYDIEQMQYKSPRFQQMLQAQRLQQLTAVPKYGTTPVDTGRGLALISETGDMKFLTDAQGKPVYKENINELVVRNPETGQPMLNPLAIQGKSMVSQAGAPRQMVSVNTQLPFKEQVQKNMGDALVKNYETLQNIPSSIQSLNRAAELAPKSFAGSMAEQKLEAVKFLNNNLGLNITPDKVQNTEELRAALFTNVMENLKKLDASPSQQQQQILQQSFGSIGTDPKAIPRIVDTYKDVLISKAKEHNRRVEESMQGPNGMVYPYSIKVSIPEKNPVKSGSKVKFLGFE